MVVTVIQNNIPSNNARQMYNAEGKLQNIRDMSRQSFFPVSEELFRASWGRLRLSGNGADTAGDSLPTEEGQTQWSPFCQWPVCLQIEMESFHLFWLAAASSWATAVSLKIGESATAT